MSTDNPATTIYNNLIQQYLSEFGDNPYFAGLVENLENLSSSIDDAVAVFYSSAPGINNFELAQNYASSSNGAYTVQGTEVGEFLSSEAASALSANYITQAEYNALVDIASVDFAANAEGAVVAFVEGANPNMGFWGSELETLINNPDVTRAGTHKWDSHRQRNLIQDPREEIMRGSGILVDRRAV